MKALLAPVPQRAATGIRNRALIVVIYRAGLRISEALALFPKDLDAQASTIRVLHGKGNHDRVVGLDTGAWAVVQLWLDRRAAAGINGRAPVFCTLKGRPVKSAYVRTLLPRLARKAGIDKRCHAHGLRHKHAYELATEGTPIHVIQAQLGHSSVATTDRYVKHLNPAAVVKAMQSRTWTLSPANPQATSVQRSRPHGLSTPCGFTYTASCRWRLCGFAGGHGRVNAGREIETEMVKLGGIRLAVERAGSGIRRSDRIPLPIAGWWEGPVEG